MQTWEVSNAQLLSSSNDSDLPEVPVGEDDQESDDKGETMSSNITEEEPKIIDEATDDIALVS